RTSVGTSKGALRGTIRDETATRSALVEPRPRTEHAERSGPHAVDQETTTVDWTASPRAEVDRAIGERAIRVGAVPRPTPAAVIPGAVRIPVVRVPEPDRQTPMRPTPTPASPTPTRPAVPSTAPTAAEARADVRSVVGPVVVGVERRDGIGDG